MNIQVSLQTPVVGEPSVRLISQDALVSLIPSGNLNPDLTYEGLSIFLELSVPYNAFPQASGQTAGCFIVQAGHKQTPVRYAPHTPGHVATLSKD